MDGWAGECLRGKNLRPSAGPGERLPLAVGEQGAGSSLGRRSRAGSGVLQAARSRSGPGDLSFPSSAGDVGHQWLLMQSQFQGWGQGLLLSCWAWLALAELLGLVGTGCRDPCGGAAARQEVGGNWESGEKAVCCDLARMPLLQAWLLHQRSLLRASLSSEEVVLDRL